MNRKKPIHLTLDDRIRLEVFLNEDFSLRAIASRLDKSPSTISREIRKHSSSFIPKCCDCIHSPSCSRHHICGASACKKKCKACPKAKKYCPHYIQGLCDTLCSHPLHLCNPCHKKHLCHFERRLYLGQDAHKQYRDSLVHSRDGFDLTAGQFQEINSLVSPLIRRGQSIYHIVRTNPDSLTVSESTLRRLLHSCELDARTIDLPETVKRKPRKPPKTRSVPPASKDGHLFSDYLCFLQNHDVPTVQMDCVEGLSSNETAVLSLHFVSFHMQLYFILDYHDSPSVVRMLDILEEALGKELFASCFPLILTDNGHEFSDIRGMERSLFGGQRSMVFFCEPNRSDQKAQCENNHKLFRRIVPKGTSVDHFRQVDMTLATNHINSYVRSSLFGKSPFDIAQAVLPADFFLFLLLEKTPAKDVLFKQALLK